MRAPHPLARLGLAFLGTANETLSGSRSYKKGRGFAGFVLSADPERQGLTASRFKTTQREVFRAFGRLRREGRENQIGLVSKE